jgi:hypothetical protein
MPLSENDKIPFERLTADIGDTVSLAKTKNKPKRKFMSYIALSSFNVLLALLPIGMIVMFIGGFTHNNTLVFVFLPINMLIWIATMGRMGEDEVQGLGRGCPTQSPIPPLTSNIAANDTIDLKKTKQKPRVIAKHRA